MGEDARSAKGSLRRWGAMAAGLAAGLAIGFVLSAVNQPSFAIMDGDLVARGSLKSSLDHRLAGDDGGDVRIGLTFRDRSGNYCRTFSLHRTAGLACAHDGAWRIVATAQQARFAEARASTDLSGVVSGHDISGHDVSGHDVSGIDLPPAVLDAANALIKGEVLDAAHEANARDRGWPN